MDTKFPKKTADERIHGIAVHELDFAQALLWQCGIYMEIVTDRIEPLILVAPEDLARARTILSTAGIIKGE
jgi:hypothetical protein